MIAETMLGRGDQALAYYKAILPAARNKIAEKHRTEPYVYAQMIAGKESPKFGEAKNSWLTGTAAWNFIAISQYILGCRPTSTGSSSTPASRRSGRASSWCASSAGPSTASASGTQGREQGREGHDRGWAAHEGQQGPGLHLGRARGGSGDG